MLANQLRCSNNVAMSNAPTPSANRPPAPAGKKSLPKFKKNKPAAAPSEPPTPALAPLASSRSVPPRPSQTIPSRSAQTHSPSAAAAPSTQPSPQPVKVPQGYTAVSRWGDYTIFAYNTDSIPPNPAGTVARGQVGSDGYWGLLEYTIYPQFYDPSAPFLAYMELPTPDTQTWLEFRPLKRAELDQTALPAVCRLEEDLHERVRKLSWKYRSDFDKVVKLIQRVCSEGTLPEDSTEYDMLSSMIIPKATAANMTKRWGTLEYFSVRSFGDAVAGMRAWQRAAREISGFIDFSAAILQKAKHPWAERWVERRRRHDISPRRGSIFTGDYINKHLPWFIGLGLPAFARVLTKDLDFPVRYIPTGPYRCSVLPSDEFSMLISSDDIFISTDIRTSQYQGQGLASLVVRAHQSAVSSGRANRAGVPAPQLGLRL